MIRIAEVHEARRVFPVLEKCPVRFYESGEARDSDHFVDLKERRGTSLAQQLEDEFVRPLMWLEFLHESFTFFRASNREGIIRLSNPGPLFLSRFRLSESTPLALELLDWHVHCRRKGSRGRPREADHWNFALQILPEVGWKAPRKRAEEHIALGDAIGPHVQNFVLPTYILHDVGAYLLRALLQRALLHDEVSPGKMRAYHPRRSIEAHEPRDRGLSSRRVPYDHRKRGGSRRPFAVETLARHLV